MGENRDVRVLHVDTDSSELDSVTGAMEGAESRFSVRMESCASDALSVLQTSERSFDCVVSEFELPDRNGLKFLEAVRDEFPRLPFIIFTGAGSEDVASDAFSAGATGYLQKDRGPNQYERLIARISEAVESYHTESEQNRIQQALETAIRGIALIDEDGRYVYLTESYANIYGYTRAELLGEHWETLYPEDEANRFHDEILPALEQKGEWQGRSRGQTLDGQVIFEEVSLTQLETGGHVCVVRDISHSEQREEELELLTQAVTEAPIGVTLTDPDRDDNPIIYANDQLTTITGYSQEEILGENHRVLQGPKTATQQIARMREAVEAGEPVMVELRNYRKDGSMFWNKVSIAPVHDHQGTLSHFIGFQEDITERKEREQALRQSDRRFEATFEDPNILVGLLEPDGSVISTNRTSNEYLKGSSKDFAGVPLWETPWFSGDQQLQQEVKQMIEQAADGEYVECEIDHSQALGENLIVRGAFRPVTDEEGDVVSLILSTRDITERRRKTRELSESEARYQSLTEDVLDTSEVGTFILNSELEVVWMNETMETYFDLDREDALQSDKTTLVEDHIREVVEDPDVFEERLRSAYEENTQTLEFECHVLPGGTRDERWLKHWSKPIESGYYEGGRIEHYTNITERKRRNQQLNALARVLRHNVRNEMNVVLGGAETIANSTDGKPSVFADSIIESGQKLLSITEKQREVVELLTSPPTPQKMDLSTLVPEAVAQFTATHPDAEIVIQLPEELLASVVPQFKKAVEELVENAIVHNHDERTTTVEISGTETADRIRLSVTDSGPGIPKPERAILRGEGERGQLYHGSGMGLWLVNRIVTVSNGHVEYQDDERGTTIDLLLEKPPLSP